MNRCVHDYTRRVSPLSLVLVIGVLIAADSLSVSAQSSRLSAARPAPSPTPTVDPVVAPPARSLSLREVLDSAVAHFPAVEIARARVRVARGVRTTAGVLGNPMLAYDVENAPFPGGSPIRDMARENMTTATLPLTPLYQRGARVRQADAELRAAESAARATRQRVALDATRAYYHAVVATVSAEAAENLALWLDSVVVYNRSRVREGAAAEADLIRSQLERDRARADAAMEAAELARARGDLGAFMSDQAAMPTDLALSLDDAPMDWPSESPIAGVTIPMVRDTTRERPTPVKDRPTVAAGGPADVERRPDVLAARERLAAANAAAAVEQRMIVREFAATFGVKQSAGTNSLMAGLSLPLPLFDQNRGEVARARAEREAAAFELAGQRRTARADLSGAETAARILTERAGLLAVRDSSHLRPAYLVRADEARAITFGAYREGAVSLLQVLDAARAWGEARVAYYRMLSAQHEAVLAFIVARGDDPVAVLSSLHSAPSGAPVR